MRTSPKLLLLLPLLFFKHLNASVLHISLCPSPQVRDEYDDGRAGRDEWHQCRFEENDGPVVFFFLVFLSFFRLDCHELSFQFANIISVKNYPIVPKFGIEIDRIS